MLRSPKLTVLALVLATIATDECGGPLKTEPAGDVPADSIVGYDFRDVLDVNVRTVTRGVQIDPDGYFLTIDGETASSGAVFAPIQTRTLTVVDGEGLYIYELRGVEDNCVVSPPNPREVVVRANFLNAELFEIECVASTFGRRR